jgi:hypothetical protein
MNIAEKVEKALLEPRLARAREIQFTQRFSSGAQMKRRELRARIARRRQNSVEVLS